MILARGTTAGNMPESPSQFLYIVFLSAFCIQVFTPGVVGGGAPMPWIATILVRLSVPVERALGEDFLNGTLSMMLDPHPGRQSEVRKGP